MFLPCPNCGFLVALVRPRSHATEQRCPRCGQVLAPGAAAEPDASSATHATRDARGVAAPADDPADDRVASAPEPRMHASHRDAEAAADAAADHAPPTGPDSLRSVPVPASTAVTGPPRVDAPRADAAAKPGQPQVTLRARPGGGAPSFARRGTAPVAPARSWPLYLASLALAFVLALQLVLAQRQTLAADVRWRPSIEALCGALGCTVPAWREPGAFTMLDRSVQPRPGEPGVLSAHARFRNDARWPQPWPTLVLTLSGVDGEPRGMRAFPPEEYAGGPQPPLAPGQTANVQVDVVEPGPGVVAFAFDFR